MLGGAVERKTDNKHRPACLLPKINQRFALSQSHFAYRLVFLERYRIRPVPKITDFDRAASAYPSTPAVDFRCTHTQRAQADITALLAVLFKMGLVLVLERTLPSSTVTRKTAYWQVLRNYHILAGGDTEFNKHRGS